MAFQCQTTIFFKWPFALFYNLNIETMKSKDTQRPSRLSPQQPKGKDKSTVIILQILVTLYSCNFSIDRLPLQPLPRLRTSRCCHSIWAPFSLPLNQYSSPSSTYGQKVRHSNSFSSNRSHSQEHCLQAQRTAVWTNAGSASTIRPTSMLLFWEIFS